ncbi:spermidine/putrescine ABC transporter substrate-binding protein [Deefgea tanakiae]|jgi:spermidine/putrescine transport system substrate-binding protein|uniref:Putrescine-binding periplasmic protein n=1 Tax=Deefgea tanakiae TaxID=2865840 RepID=A0ABX8Z5Y3_9NEIS|nr:spermidine/putrescine ABC transporter substrate-binding protein [Deefgea tanakiae]QZA77966.1 spermidine/putrescine ABC transporter substrate-binding protein [Deefgea tanakiae]
MKKLLLALMMTAGFAQAEDVLHVYNWNNYIAPETVKRFEQSCKCRVVQDYYGAMEEMLAKLSAGAKGYDVVVPTGFAIPPLIKQNLVQPLDMAKLPNAKNINPAFMNSVFDPGNKHSLPYSFTTTLLGYNETKLKELGVNSDSWAVIFDPVILAKMKGKVTVLDDSREVFAAALMYNGFSANSTNPAELQKAQETILKAKPFWAAFNSQSYIKELTVGNIWVAHGYSSDMFQAVADAKAAKRKFAVNFGLQKEGNTLSVDNMMILKNAPRPDLAYKFMNFMLEGKNAADLTNMIGAGNPNLAAVAFVKPEIKALQSVFPDAATMKRLQQLNALEGKQLRELNKLWTKVKTSK